MENTYELFLTIKMSLLLLGNIQYLKYFMYKLQVLYICIILIINQD